MILKFRNDGAMCSTKPTYTLWGLAYEVLFDNETSPSDSWSSVATKQANYARQIIDGIPSILD